MAGLETFLADPAVVFVMGYLSTLPSSIMNGDISAIIIGMILFYIALIAAQFLSYYLLKVIKKIIVLVIVGSAFYTLGIELMAKMAGGDPVIMLLGMVGIAIGFIATLFALLGVFSQSKKTYHQLKGVPVTYAAQAVQQVRPQPKTLAEERGYYEGPAARQQSVLATNATPKKSELERILSGETSLTTVLTYILIAEFGVFSSITLSAPTIEAGVVLSLAFLLAVGIFTIKSYDNVREGALFLGIALVIAVVLSFVLGVYWAQHPWSELLSTAYFKSDALVAAITGVALSMFMGKSSK